MHVFVICSQWKEWIFVGAESHCDIIADTFLEESCGHALTQCTVFSLTISSNAESIGSHKESRPLVLKSMERWMVVWGRRNLGFFLKSGYVSLSTNAVLKLKLLT